eukprot:TRINITY_DN94984_c0_g1_i1.p1 TRINITY_DN94984_c0_g1~~TRINITY_DN94984_c0_g1_i1.p1  ORF type:complete len:280 (-),score=70.46 TRINITY_DN94984_c0_g1_i1:213-1052(-)
MVADPPQPETPVKKPLSEKEAAVAKSEEVEAARSDALSWDEYFMSVAFLTALRSKDPSTQVGAVIVNKLNRIIGVGYNGFPSGCADEALPWAKSSQNSLETKYPYVVHAELNAVMNKNAESCHGCRLYSTLFPCNECAKVIIQAGIKTVIYASDKHHGKDSSKASRKLFELAGVQMLHYAPKSNAMYIPLRYPEDEPGPEPSAPQTPEKNRVFAANPSSTLRYAPCSFCSRTSLPFEGEDGMCSPCEDGSRASKSWKVALAASAATAASIAMLRFWHRR